MSLSPFRRPIPVDDLSGALRELRATGHRVTAARRLVLEALFRAEGPVSAEYLAGGMGGGGTPMDAASVHRNLVQLEELGLVRHVHIGHGPGLYAIVGSAEREYLACERCGRVTSVEPSELDPVREQIRREFGYEANFGHFPVVGLCRSCAEEDAGKSGGRAKGGAEHEHSHGGYVHSHPHRHNAEHSH